MKKIYAPIIIIILAIITEYNVLQYTRFLAKYVDLLIISLVFFTLYLKSKLSLPLTILAGLLKDTLSSSNFGTYTFSFVTTYILINQLRKWIMKEGIFINILYVTFFVFLALSFIEIIKYVLHDNSINIKILLVRSILPRSIISGLLCPFCFKILSKIIE